MNTRHDQVIMTILDEYNGTPEEFGSILAIATAPWTFENAHKRHQERSWIHRNFDLGRELIRLEDKANVRKCPCCN